MMIGLARKDSDPGSRPKEGPAASKGNKSEAIQEQIKALNWCQV